MYHLLTDAEVLRSVRRYISDSLADRIELMIEEAREDVFSDPEPHVLDVDIPVPNNEVELPEFCVVCHDKSIILLRNIPPVYTPEYLSRVAITIRYKVTTDLIMYPGLYKINRGTNRYERQELPDGTEFMV